MKILTVDYTKPEQYSTMAIIEYNDVIGYRIINIKHIENVANVEQVIKICMQFYEKYNCDKLFFEK